MKNIQEQSAWRELSELEMTDTFGGNWFSDFRAGFKEGFNWVIGVLDDIKNLVVGSNTRALK